MARESGSKRWESTIHGRIAVAEREIPDEWIARALFDSPDHENDAEDPAKWHAFAAIPEFDGRILHVVYNADSTPWRLITAYFDRNRRKRTR